MREHAFLASKRPRIALHRGTVFIVRVRLVCVLKVSNLRHVVLTSISLDLGILLVVPIAAAITRDYVEARTATVIH